MTPHHKQPKGEIGRIRKRADERLQRKIDYLRALGFEVWDCREIPDMLAEIFTTQEKPTNG